MNRNMEYNNYSTSNNYSSFDSNFDSINYDTPMINPINQYEQAYMYYKYLTQQIEYKIKCKEYEKLTKTN